MFLNDELTTERILAVFVEEITARDGQVTDTVDDGRRLLARSVLPRVEEVRENDRLQNGVAVKLIGGEVELVPYVFRQICGNGAIIACALETNWSVNAREHEPDEVIRQIRAGVAVVCADHVFTTNVGLMRAGCATTPNDTALMLMPILSRLSALGSMELVSLVMDRFIREGEPSPFGLANAVTATARETRDPELRWNLEELGGAIAIGAFPTRPADKGTRAVSRPGQLVVTG